MAMFTGFKPQGLQKIASKMGYAGRMEEFDQYLQQNPDKQREMIVYQGKAQEMARGGVVRKMAVGGTTTATTPEAPQATGETIGGTTIQRMYQPGVPQGGVTVASGIPTSTSQEIESNMGTVAGNVSVPTALATTAQASSTQERQANTMQATQASTAVDSALSATQAAQVDPTDPRAQVTAAQQTASSVGNLQAEQIQAASATPTDQATVQGQLASLTNNFDATNPPAWAAGALRGVQAQMAARGLGASSMAGQAMVQAALESALPIAQADANIQASFEQANLSNRQQRAMLAAQQRATFIGQEFDQGFQSRVANASKIADVANKNFTAEQQVALENSRAAQTMNINNLSNRQAMTMAEASALANLDMSNLNNRQQTAVQNAQSFLQMDMANLSNQQQMDMFAGQQQVQSMFTDQAVENASRQFNATSQNQTDQFFSSLGQQANQFNATQMNAQEQFNAGQTNTIERFNAEINNQRDQFNAQNQTVIAQSNATWRRQIATEATGNTNRANELNAQNVLGISNQAYNNLWQYYGDTMEWAWTSKWVCL
jgi:hypothetical protein